MNKETFAQWALANLDGNELHIKKDQVYVLSCGLKTYTWLVLEGVMFTSLTIEHSDNALANTIWRKDDMIHSFDEDIMLPLHALTDATIMRFSSEQLNGLVRQDPELAWWLAQHYHWQFKHTLDNYRHAALETSENRLAFLEETFDSMEELDGVKISDATMAEFLGMHRVSVSRLRKKLASGK